MGASGKKRALTVYPDHIVQTAFSSLLAGDGSRLNIYGDLIKSGTANEQRNIIFSLIRILSRRLDPVDIDQLDNYERDRRKKLLAGAAALLSGLIRGNDRFRDLLIQWVTGTAAIGVGQGITIHRAVIAALAQDQRTHLRLLSTLDVNTSVESMKEIFQRTLGQFGDRLYIKHTPILQQEGLSFCPLCCLLS